MQMDWALIAAVTVFLALSATALCVSHLVSRRTKRQKRAVGYQREEIQINAADVPEFKPTWRAMRDKREVR